MEKDISRLDLFSSFLIADDKPLAFSNTYDRDDSF
jgi:hypothetical protein